MAEGKSVARGDRGHVEMAGSAEQGTLSWSVLSRKFSRRAREKTRINRKTRFCLANTPEEVHDCYSFFSFNPKLPLQLLITPRPLKYVRISAYIHNPPPPLFDPPSYTPSRTLHPSIPHPLPKTTIRSGTPQRTPGLHHRRQFRIGPQLRVRIRRLVFQRLDQLVQQHGEDAAR